MRQFLRRFRLRLDGGSTPPAPRRVILRLECLEDRTVPDGNATGTIQGTVFADSFDTQVYSSSNNAVLPGVEVTLTGTTAQGRSVDQSVASDGNGSFSFENVVEGTYQLVSGSSTGFLGSITAAGPSIDLGGGQTVNQNLGIVDGFEPQSISLLLFLTTTTQANFPYAPGGPGQNLVNSRPDNAPIVSATLANQVVNAGSSATQIDLAGYFTDPDITDSQVTFNVTSGTQSFAITVTLLDTLAPRTVANFFDYINSGAFNNAIFSRLVSNFVLQGGGLTVNSSGTSLSSIPLNPAVPNEFSTSNTADTLAMALSSGNPNSATDQFFFNLVDNSSNLDPQKFTVFGKVTSITSQQTLNTLASTPVHNESSSVAASQNPTVDLSNVPLTGYSGTLFPSDASFSNFVVINSISMDQRSEYLTYSATSSNPNLVTASVKNEWLTLNYAAGKTGTATITVQAIDSFGVTVAQSFQVTVK